MTLTPWLKRLPEITVGLVALGISGLTLWMCVYALVDPSDASVPRFQLWSIMAFLAGIAIALGLFGLRLIDPRLRLAGQHLIGVQGLVAIAFFYGLMIVVGLVTGGAADGRLILALAVLFAVATLIWDRLRT